MIMGHICTHRQWLYGCGWVVLYLLHVAYLSLGRFNYGYNMAACVSAGLPTTAHTAMLASEPHLLPPGILYAAVWTVWSIKVRGVEVLWVRVRNTCILGMEQKTVHMEVFGGCGVW